MDYRQEQDGGSGGGTPRGHIEGHPETIGRVGMCGSARPIALVALLALATLGVTAARRATVASAADGLPPGVPMPSWARGHWVHFDPAERPTHPLTRSGSAERPTHPLTRSGSAERPNHPLTRSGSKSPPTGGQPAASPTQAGPLTGTGEPLRYYGGPVENEPRLVLIFWGEGWSGAQGLEHELEAMADGLTGSGFQGLLTQYSSFEGPISPGPLVGSPVIEKYYDPSPVPAGLGWEPFFEEGMKVTEVIHPGSALDTTYAVLPAPGTTYAAGAFPNACGWHESIDRRGPDIEEGAFAGILVNRPYCNTSVTLSHEYAESVTDPHGTGWAKVATPAYEEIADVCSHLGPQRMADGSLVSALWDDSKHACEVEDESPEPVPIGPLIESTTEAATNVSTESEKLEASLEPCGQEAHYYFEYGPTEAYGRRTAEATIPAQWGEVREGVTIAGLQHSIAYDWRVVVRTGNGTVYGFNNSFTIPYYVEVRTESPAVGTTTATLNDGVEPAGAEAKYHFEYGATEAYGSSTAEASAGSGEGFVRVSAPISGLSPATLYHYRIVASSSRGVTVGRDQAFLTHGGEPFAETLPATRVGYNESTLWGTVNAKGVPTNVYFEYGTTSAYGQRSFEQSAEWPEEEELAAIVRGLAPDTTYHLRVVATNSYGTTYGADQTFSTGETPSVETETAAAVGYDDATLRGAIDPRGTELEYYFEYGTSDAYGSRTAEASAGSGVSEEQTTQIVGGLAEGTTYHFRVVVHNSAPNEYGIIHGADQTFSTGTQPGVQTGAATAVGSTGATLSGTVDPHGPRVEYYFEYGLTPEYDSSTARVGAGSEDGEVQASQAIAGLSPGSTYHYRLVAVYDSIRKYGADLTFAAAATTPIATPLPPLVEVVGSAPVPNETLLPPVPHETPPPPSVQNPRESAKRWRESNRLARIGRAKTPTGTTFSFSLDEQATVSFSFTQLPGGPRGAHGCLAETHASAKHTICNTARVGALSFAGHSGTNNVLFAGRISHTNKLKPGRYELTIAAANSSGQRSTPVSLIFTIVK